MLCLVWNQRNWARSNGNLLRTIGAATMKPARQCKPSAFTWMKCLQLAVMRTKYPLTTAEIAAAQWADASLKHLFKRNAVIDQGLEIKLIENTTCACKDGQLVTPKPLQVHAVKWYHHYLQHPGQTRLEEMMNAAMYWKGMRTTIQSITKSCKSCQVNKRRSQIMGTSHQRLSIQSCGNVNVLTSLVHTLVKAR